jgi:acetyl esterase/lipase
MQQRPRAAHEEIMLNPEDIAPRLDPELAPAFMAQPRPDGALDLAAMRRRLRQAIALLGAQLPPGDDVRVHDIAAPADGLRPAVPMRVFESRRRESDAVLLWIHGGGFFAGHHEDDGLFAIPMVRETGCTIVSAGYRRPPEHPYPAAVDDCMAALRWLAGPARPLGFAPGKLAIGGISAGGCLAAVTALRARDENGPALCFQLLLVPCVDSRSDTPSMHEIEDSRSWRRSANLAAWQMYAGPGCLGELPPYAAPGRAKDLSGLPPAYIEVAEVDPLRDEAIDYAARLMRAGVRTELHVYPGAYHASTYYQPQAEVSRRAAQDTAQALRRALR